jgi:hypothetical protein
MYCEIKQKRARDLTNRDVIRHQRRQETIVTAGEKT